MCWLWFENNSPIKKVPRRTDDWRLPEKMLRVACWHRTPSPSPGDTAPVPDEPPTLFEFLGSSFWVLIGANFRVALRTRKTSEPLGWWRCCQSVKQRMRRHGTKALCRCSVCLCIIIPALTGTNNMYMYIYNFHRFAFVFSTVIQLFFPPATSQTPQNNTLLPQ